MGYWTITGFDGNRKLFDRHIPALTVPEVSRLLQRLASRHLSDEEVINASLRKRGKYRTELLEVRVSGGRQSLLNCGENPYYTARYIRT